MDDVKTPFGVLYLDIDGVLNGHEKLPGSVYCGIRPDCMARLNRVLQAANPSIILSSAWRYQIINGATTTRGFEFMLCSHGLLPRLGGGPWIIGHTPADERIPERWDQIKASMHSLLPRGATRVAVVDDLDIAPPDDRKFFVLTDGKFGLADRDADRLIELLRHG